MDDVIDKPPIDAGKPPELPPYLRHKRRGNGPIRILPSLGHASLRSKTMDADRTWWTLHFIWMIRVNVETGFVEGPVHRDSRQYRNWMETYDPPEGVPPHVVFGGAVNPGPPDPTFHSRWVEYVKEHFV